MKRLSMLAVLALAPLALPLRVEAEGRVASPDGKTAEALVQRELVQPLAVKEREQSRFSRARLPARERRVRILDDRARRDATGASFVSFVIDERHGVHAGADDDEAGWRLAAVTGCAYLEHGEVFVKIGDRHRPAAILLGKNVKPAAEQVCRGQAPEVAITPAKD